MASSTNNIRDEEAYLRQHGLQGQRLSIWEVLGIVSTFRQNVERLKLTIAKKYQYKNLSSVSGPEKRYGCGAC